MRVMYNLLTIASVALVIWISSSWVGVMTHTAGKDYSNYNFFVMLGVNKKMNEPPRKEYVIRLLYTLLGRQQGVEYDKVFYTDKDGVEHEVKKEEPYH